MTFEEMAERYCERQQLSVEGLRATLVAQKKRFGCIGWMLLECQMMGSFSYGTLRILAYGPENTYLYPVSHSISLTGAASDMSVVVGTLLAEDLPRKAIGK